MNLGMKAVLHYCNINKLSINFKKTNYMLISPPQKATNIIIRFFVLFFSINV